MNKVISILIGVVVLVCALSIFVQAQRIVDLEETCTAQHGTFIKSADIMQTVCIYPPKQ